MLIRLKGGRVFDPAQNLNGDICDIWFENGFIISKPDHSKMPDVDYDISVQKLHHFEVENVSAIQTDDERFSAHACGKPYEALNAC